MQETTTHQQAVFLTRTAGVRLHDDRTLIEVHGEDRQQWLNGQITNDVSQVPPGRGVYALATTVKGRVIADAWVLAEPDRLLVAVPASAAEAVLASFDKYLIMEDVELSPRSELAVLALQGPEAKEVMRSLAPRTWWACDELGTGGLWTLCPRNDVRRLLDDCSASAQRLGGGPVTEAGWELARLRSRVPRFGVDFDQHCYPQEAGLKNRAVRFDKGCYLGQEVVCMLENRGQLKRRLVALHLPLSHPGEPLLPPPGQALETEDGSAVGGLTSVAHDTEASQILALGYVKRDFAHPGRCLLVGCAPATVDAVVGED